jgi:hypothetical protein
VTTAKMEKEREYLVVREKQVPDAELADDVMSEE